MTTPTPVISERPSPMSAGKGVHGDHRIAMAAAVLASTAAGPTVVRSGGSHRTSYPEFVDMLEQLGIKSEQVEP